MLRSQARQYAQAFHVDGLEYFKASSSWVANFKQRYMNPTTKSNENSSPSSPTPPPPPPPAPTLLLENTSIPSSSSTTVVEPLPNINNNNHHHHHHHHHDLPPEFNQYNSQTTHELSVPVESFSVDTVDPIHVAHQWTLTHPEQDNLIPSDPAQSVIEMCEGGNEMESIKENEEEDEQIEDTYEDMGTPCYDVPHELNSPDNTHPPAPLPPHEPTIIETTTTTKETTTKLTAKQHLEAALAFYTSQNETNQSMSANMIKLILQNDF